MVANIPWINLLIISSWMQFWFYAVVLEYVFEHKMIHRQMKTNSARNSNTSYFLL
jgi:hypothetical protein